MDNDDPPAQRPAASSNAKPSREERMAAKLRENLRRRKHQARARVPGEPKGDAGADGEAGSTLPKREDGG